ncbi:MAG: caspase family protein [Pseudomonadota bacterium]
MALVIGNDTYAEVPSLHKAVNDAEAVAEALDAQGYRVIRQIDATRREMNRAISEFTARLQPGDTALIFYAGHGVEIDGENYLLPVDIVDPAGGDGDFVASESIALSRLLDRVRATGARTTLAIIDACRENPFAQASGRSIGGARGLGRVAAPEGTFVIFSAGAGQLALDRLSDDDPDPNSVFTRALLPRLFQPELELRELVSEVRLEVRDLALTQDHAQFPAYYDELLGEFYLASTSRRITPPPSPAGRTDTIRRDFDLARDIGTAAAFEAFLEKHSASDDSFALDLARDMLAALEPAAPSGPEKPAPAEPATAEPAAAEPAGAEPAASPAPDAPPEPEQDTRAIVREVQTQLNRLGCSAGSADGIAGPRTRAAWAKFLSEGDVRGLTASDLATPAAVAALQERASRVCAAAPAAETATATARASTPTPEAAPEAAPTGPDLAGTWNYRAKCPLFIQVTGSVRLRRVGDGRYAGQIADSLGQRGSVTVTVIGRTMQGRNDWGNIIETWTATLAADGRTYNARSSTGCTSTSTRG